MPYYNVTALADNVTGLDTMIASTNSATGGWFGGMLLISLTTIFMMAFYQRTGDMNRSITATCFIMFILTSLAWVLNWIPGWALWVFLLAFAAALMFTWRYR